MTRKSLLLVLADGALAIALVSCQKNNPYDDWGENTPLRPITLTKSEQVVNAGARTFSYNLLNEVASLSKPDENIVISPLSISTALAMTMQGATRETLAEMRRALSLDGLSDDDIRSYYKTIMTELPKMDGRVRFNIANAIWVKDEIKVVPDFKNIVSDYFLAEAYPLTSADAVNSWCDKKTNGMIPKITNDEDVAKSPMMLTNALYFKAPWSTPFDDAGNRKFKCAGGKAVNTPFMKLWDNGYCYDNDRLTAVSVPYGNQAYRMTLVKPKGMTANELAATLNADDFDYKYGNSYDFSLLMPKFKASYTNSDDIMQSMMNLGMPKAFTDFAEFFNLADKDLKIGKITHSTVIEVDLKGTEAAAVTNVGMDYCTSIEPSKSIDIVLDSPFIYIISESSTGAVLFVGIENEI